MNELATDLDEILEKTSGLWEELRGQRVFITGGTGFFGCWLLESFAWINEKLALNASAVVLTRDYEAFKMKAPHLASNPSIKFHIGDIRNFEFPDGDFSHVIHAAATSAIATYNNENPRVKYDTVVEGTRHALNFAVECRAKKFLYTSSGAVYGKPPAEMTHIPEDYNGAPDSTAVKSAWGESKRAAEFLCAYYANRYDLEIKTARCFSFIGPYLPLDIHYAIGNFMRDASRGGPVRVNGDGTPRRSYLYASDLMIWLWTIFFKGVSGRPYNVGSEDDVTIAELAHIVVSCLQSYSEVKIAKLPAPNTTEERYVPSTGRARMELGLRQTVGLEEAIKRTAGLFKKINKTV